MSSARVADGREARGESSFSRRSVGKGAGNDGPRRELLFLVFKLGNDRYALEAGKVVEVLPLLEMKQVPHAPKGVVGVFVYRGAPVPAVDLSEVTLGKPAARLLSTRIIIVNFTASDARSHPVGLIAEEATELLRTQPQEFVHSGIDIKAAPYLGPVLMDPAGPIQWFYEQHLLTEPVQQLIFDAAAIAKVVKT